MERTEFELGWCSRCKKNNVCERPALPTIKDTNGKCVKSGEVFEYCLDYKYNDKCYILVYNSGLGLARKVEPWLYMDEGKTIVAAFRTLSDARLMLDRCKDTMPNAPLNNVFIHVTSECHLSDKFEYCEV